MQHAIAQKGSGGTAPAACRPQRATRIPPEHGLPHDWRKRVRYSEEAKGMVWTGYGASGGAVRQGRICGTANAAGRRYMHFGSSSSSPVYNIDDLVWRWFNPGGFAEYAIIHINGDLADSRYGNLALDMSKRRKKRHCLGVTAFNREGNLDGYKIPSGMGGTDLPGEEKLIAHIIHQALWLALRDVKRLKARGRGYRDILATSEPVRFILGADGRLQWLLGASRLDAGLIARRARRILGMERTARGRSKAA